MSEDTIAAIATGVDGSIAIIRISGPDALAVGCEVWCGSTNLADHPRALLLGRLTTNQGEELDQCLATWMPGPKSYTGEDVVEIHTHGGPQAAQAALGQVLAAGARHADPGEFTKRAFINGKLDLTQAEAVADIITSHSEMALRTATRQLQGRLGRCTDQLHDQLTGLLAEVEVRMDFVDEDLDWMSPAQLLTIVQESVRRIDDLLSSEQTGRVLRNGIKLVIAGAPNAGKSSLLNLILGQDRAIVTEIPGTTRDSLEELAHIRGIPVRLIDTAGLREATDQIEREGVERSYSHIAEAQVVLRVLDASQPFAGQELAPDLVQNKAVIAIANKSDLAVGNQFAVDLDEPALPLCTLSGEGLDEILDAIERAVWGHPHQEEPEIAINARHSALLQDAATALKRAEAMLPNEEWELLTVELRTAIDALGKITGRTVQSDILDYIFSRFCIGK